MHKNFPPHKKNFSSGELDWTETFAKYYSRRSSKFRKFSADHKSLRHKSLSRRKKYFNQSQKLLAETIICSRELFLLSEVEKFSWKIKLEVYRFLLLDIVERRWTNQLVVAVNNIDNRGRNRTNHLALN